MKRPPDPRLETRRTVRRGERTIEVRVITYPGGKRRQLGEREAALSGRPASVRVRIGLAAERCSYETNAFRTEEAVHRFVPWIGGTFVAFSCAAICSSDILFPSIALILMRHPKSRRLQSRCPAGRCPTEVPPCIFSLG